jgi:hypothetical protein
LDYETKARLQRGRNLPRWEGFGAGDEELYPALALLLPLVLRTIEPINNPGFIPTLLGASHDQFS